MLKRRSIRKILASSLVLVAMFLVYIIPKDKEYALDVEKQVEYVDKSIEFKTVYLLDKNNLVSRSKVALDSKNKSIINQAKELIEVLIVDGKYESKVPSGFKAIIPSDTKIIGVDYNDGLLKINFSKEILDIEEDLEEKLIESLCYTLTSINSVNSIIIYVEGDILNKMPKSKIVLPSTLDKSYGANKEYKITNKDNYQKVTIYYVSEYNDNYYYVPVTKYVNDSRDKIKIIVEELASNYSYNTNLMSFLNSNTKLLASSVDDGVLNLTFNNYIFKDANEKDLLEEVIYTISLSIWANYDVTEVNFEVDNQEIYKSVLKTLE